MAPHQSKATRVRQQRQTQPKKSKALKEAGKQARRRVVTRRVTKTGSKAVFKL